MDETTASTRPRSTTRRGRRILAVLATLTAGIASGCAPDPTGAPGGGTGSDTAWQVEMTTVSGGTVDLADLDGLTVLFWFWAPY